MIEAQPFAVHAPLAEPPAVPVETPARPTSGRKVLVLSILVFTAALAVWVNFKVGGLITITGSGKIGDLLNLLTQWRVAIATGVVGGGLSLCLLTMVMFRVTDKSRAKQLQAVRTESAALIERLRIRTDHLQILITEKSTLVEHLHKIRAELEGNVAVLTGSNEEMKGELDRLKRAERTMSMQSQNLVASKDVLQITVQARQQEVQKLQRQCEMILNAAGEGICGIDPAGKITFVNPTAARLMGLEVGKMVGLKETDLFKGTPGSVPADDSKKPAEVELTRTDKSTFTAEFMRSQIVENNRVVGGVVLFKDITERKQAAEALEHKAAELTRSNAELEQFAFVASHDLQEPLRKIRAFGDRLQMKCESALPAEGADYLGRMQNAAARMQTLIADLLTFSRVISRTEPFVEVDLAQVTREVLGDLEVRVEKAGATVTVGSLPKIEADPMQMRQLLQNLIGNALKFQASGVKPQIEITASVVKGRDEYDEADIPVCELTVQDNGIGFDEKYLEKIFAVFQRLHNRQEYEGTGIGLAVCRRIVDRHGGSITARSKPGAGATFIVRLPVKPPCKRL
jgi:PAS domain S-box-containing protein